MIYTVMSTDNGDTVAIEDGVLISGSNSGQAALHITAQEEFGINQTLVLLIKVGNNKAFYATNFEKAEGAYWFWLVYQTVCLTITHTTLVNIS